MYVYIYIYIYIYIMWTFNLSVSYGTSRPLQCGQSVTTVVSGIASANQRAAQSPSHPIMNQSKLLFSFAPLSILSTLLSYVLDFLNMYYLNVYDSACKS